MKIQPLLLNSADELFENIFQDISFFYKENKDVRNTVIEIDNSTYYYLMDSNKIECFYEMMNANEQKRIFGLPLNVVDSEIKFYKIKELLNSKDDNNSLKRKYMDFEKQEIRNCIYELQWEMDLEQFVKELQALQSDEFFKCYDSFVVVPETYSIPYSDYECSEFPTLKVYGVRLETDQEFEQRKKEFVNMELQEEEAELKLLKQLKEKYEK